MKLKLMFPDAYFNLRNVYKMKLLMFFCTSLSNQHVTDRAIAVDNTSDLGHITSSITTHQSFQSTSSTITPVYKSKFEQRHNYYNSKTSNQH
ncbi:uncharacterized protein [Rutidosis leptorrhynchoides]|uniref:uncharacterized protein isoform X3 n=1 Tax=Rutidosis leptorrhynchoides TaxID=125765 RepID=UPI003A98D422